MIYKIHILTICFVRDMTRPQVLILCSWSSNISACLDRLPIWRGSILLLSTCTVAAIPCCSFFPRSWLSGLQITMLKSWMCLQDLKKYQGEFIYMVYVLYITCICRSYLWYIHVLAWLFSLQDCLATIHPHPFYIGERDNEYDVAESLFDQDSMWFVRPQLFFHCMLRPIGTEAGRFNCSDEDIPLDLDFFSPFEELRLRTAGIERNSQGVRALTCSHTLRLKGWGPPRQSPSHSMLSGRKCNLNYST